MSSSYKEAKKQNHFTHKIYANSNTNTTSYKYTELDSDLLIESLDSEQSIRVISINKKNRIQVIPLMLTVIVAFHLLSFYNETKIIQAVNFQTSLLTGLTYKVNDLLVEYSSLYQKLLTATNEKIAQEVRKIVYRRPAAKTPSSKKVNRRTKKFLNVKNAQITPAANNISNQLTKDESRKNKSRAQAILEAEMEAEKAQTSRFLNMNLFEEEKTSQRNDSKDSSALSTKEVKPEFERAQSTSTNRKID